MKNRFKKWQFSKAVFSAIMLLIAVNFMSCNDDELFYDKNEPEWLGASIYQYLEDAGNYETFVKLIDDVGYDEVLSKTGSKTLFVANDEAFSRFFQNNPWNVTSYNDLSLAEKKLILNFGMIDNAYLIETLSNYNDGGTLVYGTAMRRQTANTASDSILFDSYQDVPKSGPLGNVWENNFRNGMYVVKDNSASPIVYFFQKMLTTNGISNADYKVISGKDRSGDDADVFDIRVVERDIVCKNGYIHVLEDVMIPRDNMAEHIHKNPETTIFSDLLDRYTWYQPDYDLTEEYSLVNPGFSDTIYVKSYLQKNFSYTMNGQLLDLDDYLLNFSPGANDYSQSRLQADMGTMMVPTDAAMDEYFNEGAGRILKERYGSWENIPDDIITLFMNRHLRNSFMASVPSQFDDMKDTENSAVPITTGDIESSYIAVNGLVYHTNRVYPPDDYVSIYGPVLFGEKAKVFNWAIRQNDFRLYLNSLENLYSFFVPSDDFFSRYIDPFAFAKDVKGALKYWYNNETNTVNATVYAYDAATGEFGDSINVITNANFLSNRLLDMLDNHIVVDDVENGKNFYFTKENNVLKISGSGTNLKVQAGNDLVNNTDISVLSVFEQANGNTYLIDKPLQTPLRSVYKVLSETPQFSKFYELLNGFPSTSNSVVFVRRTNYYGIDYNIRFFNTFNYTVYVPTNEAIQELIDSGELKTWEEINAIEDATEKLAEIEKMERFLRYHFQDNSIFIGGPTVNNTYQSSTINLDKPIYDTRYGTYINKYFKIGVVQDGNDLFLTTENLDDNESTAQVKKDEGLYNIMARDYVFNGNPSAYREIDGSGSGSNSFTSSEIITSSTAVIHQIDRVLKFE
ncbi:fasciclin domain-containing protein [Carboxylicivirga linearis]|uniref:Fasciclin domain-containing protein n=1 Tax=Carboxylicivirga linearis TaxID=1628157 RepID=A0ABS5JXK2_9BACT|nr:fasciclin domain-containing protein [Carboxylicivirga linearis]MBS2099622.1 fasciclin domain-containing protein [Carboxylicivirga linearis]